MPTKTDAMLAYNNLWDALGKLLPSRIPGRVEKKATGATGYIVPRIRAYFSDGTEIDKVFSLQLGGFENDTEVFFELSHLPSAPSRLETRRVFSATKKEIEDAIAAYEQRIAPEVQQRLADLLLPIEEARAKELSHLEQRENALSAQEKSNAATAQELRAAQDAYARNLKKLEDDRRALDERGRSLDSQAEGLTKRQGQIDQEVSAAVAAQVAQRNLQLVQEEENLKQWGARLQQREDDLRRREEQLIADRQTLSAARAQFESEGGVAYMAYVNSLSGDDSEPVTRLESSALSAFDPQALASDLRDQGYLIPDDELRRAVVATLAAWSSGQFVILSGSTGVGKTQLVRRLAGALGAGHGYVPVRPGWVEPADLLGFYNPTQKLFEPTPFLDHVLAAASYAQSNRLYALCLDEMNLSRIENYASDILSRMERISAGEEVHLDLYSQDIAWRLHEEEQELYRESNSQPTERRAHLRTLSHQLQRYPARLQIPTNLILFGTVNVDETTQMFSPKFLDRAYVLRFRPAILPEKVASETQAATQAEPFWPLSLEKARQLTADPNPWPSDADVVWKDFREWQSDFLKPLGVHFGHRFYHSFRRYVAIGHNLGLSDVRRLGDDYFQAKVAPRIRFGREERAVGAGQTTKYQKLEDWLRDKRHAKDYSGLAGLLDTMYQRARSTEMVELWD